jgi:uncharacterized damage-inducible protein DinB
MNTLSMPLGSLLRHAANHGVHHRGHVALRPLGYATENLDLLLYCSDNLGPGTT